MMREIKFRAWHIPQRKMYSPEEMGQDQETLLPDGRGFANISSASTRLSQIHSHLLPLQYTGLKDKNGIEIYEGDILSPNNREVQFGIYHSPLEQGNGFYTLCHNLEYPQIPFSFSERQAEASEVIGNIYENEDLLK